MEDGKKLKVSENYIVGIDIAYDVNDVPMAMVTKYKGPKDIIHVNTFYGDDAIALYELLKGDYKDG